MRLPFRGGETSVFIVGSLRGGCWDRNRRSSIWPSGLLQLVHEGAKWRWRSILLLASSTAGGQQQIHGETGLGNENAAGCCESGLKIAAHDDKKHRTERWFGEFENKENRRRGADLAN